MGIDNSKFEERIKQIMDILEKILKVIKATNRLDGETILDNQDLCVMLNLSKRSLQRLRSSGILPYMQIGQKTFYLESDVMKYVQSRIDGKKYLRGDNDDDKNPSAETP